MLPFNNITNPYLMFTFMFLYFLNLVLDYPLQGSFLAEYKQKNNYALFVHSAIWGIGISLGLAFVGLFAWWKVIMLVAGHYAIDYWKCRRVYNSWFPKLSDYGAYYIDQALHVVQLLLCLI